MKQLNQHNPPHPGEILLEFYFEPLGLNVTEGARKLKITRQNMSAILNSRSGISPLMAVKLSKVFRTSPELWMNMQRNYDLWNVMEGNKALIASIHAVI